MAYRRRRQVLIKSKELRNGDRLKPKRRHREKDITLSSHRQNQKIQEDAIVNSLKVCIKQNDLQKGTLIHAQILREGLFDDNNYIRNNLVNMYAKCGDLVKAQEVFEGLSNKNIVAWNALISGYVQNGQCEVALKWYTRMQRTGLIPNAITYVCILKACGSTEAVKEGEKVHAEIAKAGLLRDDVLLGNALVDMYIKFGALSKAREVFDELPIRDVVSWTSMIAGYTQEGQGEEALECFRQMQQEGSSPNTATFICTLKACSSIEAADKGKAIHNMILRKRLLPKDARIGTTLVDMYARCGEIERAQDVFDQLPVRDVVSWSALITGYTQQGQADEALICYEKMQREGIHPNAVTFVSILKACGIMRAAEKGREVHDEIVKVGMLEKDLLIGTALVEMYAVCGVLVKAQEVFDKLPSQDIITWRMLMAGYIQHGYSAKAMECFDKMERQGISPDGLSYLAALKACGNIGDAQKGEEIHAKIEREDLLEKDTMIGIALVDMYGKCGAIAKAQKLFDELHFRNVVLWTALIAAYVQHGNSKEAMTCFERMQEEGISPSPITLLCILKACSTLRALDKGKELHTEFVKGGWLQKDIVFGNALVDMYVKCGALAKAQEVFNELPVRNVVSWSTLIGGYAQLGHGEEALNWFVRMQDEGYTPDMVTFSFILKACGSIRAVGMGEKIHAEIAKLKLLGKNIVLDNALVDMYARCGMLGKAQAVFDGLPARDVLSWSALIVGYAQHGHAEEAIHYLQQMQSKGFSPNSFIFLSILRVCASLGSVDIGKQIHKEIVREGLLEKDIMIASALVDMYTKCGMLQKAHKVFLEFPTHDIGLWNTLITGYAQRGQHSSVFNLFNKMAKECIQPNLITLTIVLNACCHSGQVDDGQWYFEMLTTEHGLEPSAEHCCCMSDLFGRAGHFEKAFEIIEKMPYTDHAPLWGALLGACQMWGNVEIAGLAFAQAVKLDDKDDAAYSCMKKIYSAAGLHRHAHRIEAMRAKKQPCSIADGFFFPYSAWDKPTISVESVTNKFQKEDAYAGC